jgi:hypothetical protein
MEEIDNQVDQYRDKNEMRWRGPRSSAGKHLRLKRCASCLFDVQFAGDCLAQRGLAHRSPSDASINRQAPHPFDARPDAGLYFRQSIGIGT